MVTSIALMLFFVMRFTEAYCATIKISLDQTPLIIITQLEMHFQSQRCRLGKTVLT